MGKYITLNHLDQTVWSLLQKIDAKTDDRISDEDITKWNSPISYDSLTDKPYIPTSQDVTSAAEYTILHGNYPVSTFQNDMGYLTSYTETDPTVPSWAKASSKPTYTAAEVGALPDTTVIPEDKVFIATYGTTSYANTLAAYNAGKLIFGVYSSNNTGKLIIPLTSYGGGQFQFEGKYLGGRSDRVSLYLQSASGWSYSTSFGDTSGRSADIESGDSLIIRDVNGGYVNKYSTLTFGTSTNQYLANNGTWQTLPDMAGFSVSVVQTLPVENIDDHTIYFLSNNGDSGNIYDEYMYVNNTWEMIGSTEVDLSNYLQKTEIADWAKAATKPTYTASEVGAVPALVTNGDKRAAIRVTTDVNTGVLLSYDNDANPGVDIQLKNDGLTMTVGGMGGINTLQMNTTETKIHNVVTPTANGDAANKQYVDNKVSSLTAADVGALPSSTVIPTVPTNVSAFTNDAGYLTSYTETDPTVPAWAKAETKPTYTAQEVGALPADTEIPIIPTNISAFNNDTGYLTSYTETDPTVPAWAKASSKPTYTAAEVGALPDTTVIPDISGKVNKSGDTMTGQLTVSYNSTTMDGGIKFTNDAPYQDIILAAQQGYRDVAYDGYYPRIKFLYNMSSSVLVGGIRNPINNDDAANKAYVDNKATLKTTAGSNNTEYNLIGTATSNTNNSAVNIYNPGSISFAKTTNEARLTLGSSSLPGKLRLYSSTNSASGFTDLISGASSTNERTITLPDATGTVALTSDIPSVSSWALAANKPSYTFSELTSHPTSIGGYGITDAYTKTEVDGMVSGVLHYKGTKATVSALPSSGNATGDVWHVTADGSEWAWDGSDWQELGTAVDLSGYVPTSRTVNGKALTSDISLTASDVSALPSSTTYVSSFNGESGAITYTAPVTSVNGQTGAVTTTDEKLSTTAQNSTGNAMYILTGPNNTTASTKYYSPDFWFGQNTSVTNGAATLHIGGASSGKGKIQFTKSKTDSLQTTLICGDPSSNNTVTLPTSSGTLALTSDIPTTASDVGALADDCAAAGITSTDISNWNALVSDDKTWNGVALVKQAMTSTGDDTYVPLATSVSPLNMSFTPVKKTPGNNAIAKYDANAYLNSTTPTSGDSSTKVATTAFVGTAIAAITASDVGALADDSVAAGITSTDISNWNAKLSSFTETDPTVPSWAKASSKPTYTASEVGAVDKTGDTMTGSLNFINSNSYGIKFQYSTTSPAASLQPVGASGQVPIVGFNTATIFRNLASPNTNNDAANKQYVDTAISGISIPQPYDATTNPTGYLRITDLPIYDGTVV